MAPVDVNGSMASVIHACSPRNRVDKRHLVIAAGDALFTAKPG
jgi:hypothetical protein